MNEQISLFDSIPPELKPGEWVSDHGRELSFDECYERVGELLIIDKSTESHEWFKVVRIESTHVNSDGKRRLVYFDGDRTRGYLDEIFFRPGYTGRFPERAYELC